MIKKIQNYSIGVIALVTIFLISKYFAFTVFHLLENSPEHEMLLIFFQISCLFGLSFIVFYISHIVKLPSFVFAIFFGMVAKPVLGPIVENHEILSILVGIGATLILFGGGIETSFTNFKKQMAKIFSLSFPGLLITAFLFSLSCYYISRLIGANLSVMSCVLLGAVLASTDPAAIIPVLKKLRFKQRSTKDIIISESAVTDVTGTLLTLVFLSMAIGGAYYSSIYSWYGQIFTLTSATILLKQIAFGIVFGVSGYFLLELLIFFKKKYEREFEADSAFFLFVPIIIFTMAIAFGGSGYLAAFIGGLLFSLTEHLYETERFFNHVVDGFFKPTIFILLGALIDPSALIQYAPIGISVALVFMFIIRPIVVFISLWPFKFWGKEKLGWREMAFISFVRETGAIPAVLLVTVASLKLVGTEGLTEVGMWVILATLIIEPIFTPAVAKILQVAEVMQDEKKIDLNGQPTAVLVTRGRSFVDRLPIVVEWVKRHSLNNITLMLCLENKYTEEMAEEIKNFALREFENINKKIIAKEEKEISFRFVSRKGFLQENIEKISQENKNVSVIFVGRKMLDYRLNEIKELSAPLFFIE